MDSLCIALADSIILRSTSEAKTQGRFPLFQWAHLTELQTYDPLHPLVLAPESSHLSCPIA